MIMKTSTKEILLSLRVYAINRNDDFLLSEIEERKEITLNLEYLRWLRDRKIYNDATKMYGEKRTIDGRWSIKNPKYIEAKKHNDKINEFINEKRKEIDKEIKEQKDKLQQYNLVSSTMWHCEL